MATHKRKKRLRRNRHKKVRVRRGYSPVNASSALIRFLREQRMVINSTSRRWNSFVRGRAARRVAPRFRRQSVLGWRYILGPSQKSITQPQRGVCRCGARARCFLRADLGHITEPSEASSGPCKESSRCRTWATSRKGRNRQEEQDQGRSFASQLVLVQVAKEPSVRRGLA